MITPPLLGTFNTKEDGYGKKNGGCGCGHDLSVPYGLCTLCAELDSNGNIIYRQIPYILSFSNETDDPYDKQAAFYQGIHSYRNPIDYTYRSKGKTGPMFMNVRVEGAASLTNSFYSNADEINGEYLVMRSPFSDDFYTDSQRDDRYCYWYGYPCNKDKIYSSAGFNKVVAFISSGVTNWWPTETFSLDSTLYSVKSGLTDIYLNCRLEFAKHGQGSLIYTGSALSKVCNEDGSLAAFKDISIIEKKVKVGTAVVYTKNGQVNEFEFINSDVRCADWNNLELTSFETYPQDYDDDNQWENGDAMDEDMFDASNLKIFITSLPNNDENEFDKFVHYSNNGDFDDKYTGFRADYPYYTFEYSEPFIGTQTGFVFADTNQDILSLGAFGSNQSQEPHLRGEILRDVYYTNPTPYAYKITVSNLQNKNCTSCTGLNGEHVLYLWGQDYISRYEDDSYISSLDSVDYYGKHFYNKEVPLPTSLGYSGTLPCIFGIKCSGVIAENFGLNFVPATNGGHIDFSINNNKNNTKVVYRKTITDLPIHTNINYTNFNTPIYNRISSSLNPYNSDAVISMCDWDSANIKIESYHDSSDYNTNCFQPCLQCFSCKDGIMPSSMTVVIDSWEFTNSVTVNAAGTYTLTKTGSTNYRYSSDGITISFTFGCASYVDSSSELAANKLKIELANDGSSCGSPAAGNGIFYYSLPVSPIGDYYSRMIPGEQIFDNTDYYDCQNVDGEMIFHSRTPISCTQTGPTVNITFNA